MENWEQSNILLAGMCLLWLSFCQESFIRAKIIFFRENEDQMILVHVKQGIWSYVGTVWIPGTPKSGSVERDFWKRT